MDDPEAQELVMPAAGVHVILPAHFSPARMGLIVPKTSDGRYVEYTGWGLLQQERPFSLFAALKH